jgi:hypothetical protein
MHIVFDRFGLQARQHQSKYPYRLSGFMSVINSLPGHSKSGFSEGPLNERALSECNILVLTTRVGKSFSQSEFEGIEGLVDRGGGVLLLSKHGNWPGKLKDRRENDAELAKRLDIALEDTVFMSSVGNLVRFEGSSLEEEHPVISGVNGSPRVRTLVSNNFCGVRGRVGEEIVGIPGDVADARERSSVDGLSFAVARECESGGRLVVVGDSGFASNFQGGDPGLIECMDNRIFVENALRWLGHMEDVSDS